MKKTLLFALAAVATIFTSCSSDINNDNDDLNNGQGKGMTLIANVEQPDTRATFAPTATSGIWKFEYTDNDNVSVGNEQMDNNYYTFTKSGENFSCADAKATKQETNWYAYYPSTTIDLTKQAGTLKSAAHLYSLAGATTTATTGAEGLTIKMKAQAAVLRIIKVDNFGPCDIYLKTKDGYVSGLTAKKNEAGFDVKTSTEKVSVLKKNNTDKAGIYYVIVPAGVYLEVWNDGIKFKTTSNGLSAGKYYTLTSGPISGTATTTVKLPDGTTKKIGWVQLWIGGPRIATENVAEKMNWTEARKTGDDYVWGKNWHTPSLDEVEVISKNSMPNTDILDATYEYNNNRHGFTLKGKQPGYTNPNNTVFFPGLDSSIETYVEGKFWLTDEKVKGYGTSMNFTGSSEALYYLHPNTKDHTYSEYEVRPVLTINTVLWGEQDIK